MNYTKPENKTNDEQKVECTSCKLVIDAKEGFYKCEKECEHYHEKCCDHGNTFTQTYSLAIMSKSKLFVKIMEYQLQWDEKASAT